MSGRRPDNYDQTPDFSLGHLNHNISSLGEALYVKQQNPSINEIDLVQLGSHPEPFGNKLKR